VKCVVALPQSIIYDTIDVSDMTNEEIIKTVKDRKKILAINQENLAELSEVGIATLKRFESGKGNITLNNLQKIVDILGLEIRLELKNTGK
jgi:transcriptional regulator with XRE-family HTH domain